MSTRSSPDESPETLRRLRLCDQSLSTPLAGSPGELVHRLVAMQAQDYLGALWAVGVRLENTTQASVTQALQDHTILRTWALRGTLHLVSPEDIRWLLALVRPRQITVNARRYGQLELDEATLNRASQILYTALQGVESLPRPALLEHLERHGISTAGQRGVFMLQRASLEGLICQDVTRRGVSTFLALDKVPSASQAAFPPEEAAARLARRYFTTHGPATLPDFAWWSGLPAAVAREALASVASRLTTWAHSGQTYYLSSEVGGTTAFPAPTAHLLPAFDEFLLSYTERSASLEPRYSMKINLGNGLSPILVLDGQVRGLWKRQLHKEAVSITLAPFEPLTGAQKQAVENAALRYGAFHDLPVRLSW
ncbi:MAG: winged helix DNA-binding domain-containing protein [Anaerolineaceae bacterium]|nr:winged helix DNA-binding domain-containing protein [Anaerolineaceae bacterium]